jgi:DNA-binding NarL/FixJ family response regulator
VVSTAAAYEMTDPVSEPAQGTLSLLIADGDARFRAGLRAVLEADVLVVGEVGDKDAAVAAATRLRPDVCLIDARLPGDGLSAVAAIARTSPATTIVVLSEFPGSAGLLEALERGASGYLPKGIGSSTLAKSLRAAGRGEPALPRAMVAELIDHLRRRPQRRLVLERGVVDLTDREWDVANLLRSGLTTAEMADRLAVSPVTVRRHVAAMLQKLGTPDRAAAVAVLERRSTPRTSAADVTTGQPTLRVENAG